MILGNHILPCLRSPQVLYREHHLEHPGRLVVKSNGSNLGDETRVIPRALFYQENDIDLEEKELGDYARVFGAKLLFFLLRFCA